ncbi:hypothetical protein [uncultured Paraglaciecola sp.]|uniref:hypothetical protein n=1 Tax=uncultured Paraglaciecola sp. TaxID=1765024 RepID=UPI0030DC575A|tara:strand:+ start:467985 stop:468911 length:927 start_codon:yes stop_codon:yes gene_type:complete
MIERIICVTLLVFCSSCSTNFIDSRALFEQRSPIANSLEDQQRYAEALTQWKILQIAYPNDEMVKEHILRLELLISDKVIQQLAVLDKAKASADETLERKVYLKILALDPNNQIAMEELRKFEWKFAIQEASSKTANIKKYFVETQQEANISIQLTKYLEQGEQLIHDRKYKELLQLADKFEDSYPTHLEPNEYRILAYSKLGEGQQKQNKTKEAIEYYQQALDLAALKGDNLPNIRKKTDQLSSLIANRYLRLANQVFKTNLDEAINYFEQSLKYQPNNVKTRQLMQRAIKIRENLLKIKKLDSNSD